MIECIDKTIGGVWEMVLGRKPTPEDKGRLQLVDIPGDYETRRVFFDELEIGYLKSGFDGNIFRSTFKPLHHWIR